ncbi:MAG TPA: ELWxxDGT repeat protein, partial [Thermoanaerobaculia bacterium]
MTKQGLRRSVPTLCLLLGLLALPPGLAGQTASLVRDIETYDGGMGPTPAVPRDLFTAGGKVFFTAVQASTGRELWATDGTSLGTELLADACAGTCDTRVTPLAAAGPIYFFRSTPGDGGAGELWRSDGTRRGTFALTFAGLHSPLQPSPTSPFALAGNVLYFEGCVSDDLAAPVCGLARSDGTVAGTRLLQPLGGQLDDPIGGIAAAAGRVFFITPRELWSSDGTPSGTGQLAVFGGPPSLLTAAAHRVFFVVAAPHPQVWTSDGTGPGSRPLAGFETAGAFRQTTGFQVSGDRAYFVADDAARGAEIWTSDGTAEGTRAATHFGSPDPFGFAASGKALPVADMALLGDRLIFPATVASGQWRLWRTDGSPRSAAPVAALEIGSPQRLVRLGGRVVFEGLTAAHGYELYSSDGTLAGTVFLGDLPHAFQFPAPQIGGPWPALGEAVFVLQTGFFQSQVWVTDGTPAGTRSWSGNEPFYIDPDGFDATFLAAARGRLFFAAVGAERPGRGLFVADGRRDGTRAVLAGGTGTASSNPQAFAALGEAVFFRTRQVGQAAVWRSAGTAASTVAVTDFVGADGEADLPPVAAGGRAFFWHLEGGHAQLWSADGGSPAIVLTHFADDAGGAQPAPLGGRALFPVAAFPDTEVWSSDGTPAGTGERFAVPRLAVHSPFESAGASVYFIAGTAPPISPALELWTSDGTEAGTRRIETLGTPDGLPDPLFTAVGPLVFFRFGTTLWRTDGTAAGTVRLFDGTDGRGSAVSEIPGVAALGGSLFFLAESPERRYLALWRSDGTPAGTVELTRFLTAAPIGGEEIAAAGGRLFLLAPKDLDGRELLASDGTGAEPTTVKDILPGPASSQPSGLTAVGDRVYFSADDGVHGFEPWTSDGTEAGTRLVQDIAPGALSSAPAGFTAAGGRLYFAADDALHGSEPWALPLAGPAGCQASATALCLAGGRFRVEADWRDFRGNAGMGTAAAITRDTGYFWFFSPANVEVVVKVLDGRELDQSFWVFYGALSTVEYTLTVTDTQSGLTRRYVNPPGVLASVADTGAFGPNGAFATAAPASTGVIGGVLGGMGAMAGISAGAEPAAVSGSCAPGPTRLCVDGGRVAITVTWKDFQGHAGDGNAAALTDASGYFWFFDPANVELLAKVIDGRAVNGRLWLFYGALSSVEYTVIVTDTQTGAIKR